MNTNYRKLLFTSSYIDGKWNENDTSHSFDILNPANNEIIIKIHSANEWAIKKSIDSANKAFLIWKKETASTRAKLLRNWFNLILEYKKELATIITLESGKPLNESLGEVIYGASFIEWFSEEAKRIYGDEIPSPDINKRISVIKQPIGTVAAITPWNFPLAMITRKTAPAIAAGCTTILRPSEETPLTALALAYLSEKAGIPPGVFNVIITQDPSPTGKILCENPLINKISFTGSTRVGKLLMNQSSSTLKKLSLELGGNAPFIVFNDANINDAVKGAVASKYRNAGQTCVCTNRFLIQDKVYDEFIEKFLLASQQLKIGNGLDPNTNIGPLINKKAIDKMEIFINDAIDKGGNILLGGKKVNDYFFLPTIIERITPNMLIAQEEIFGPIAPIIKFNTEEEAIAIANNTEYGLASYFYTENIKRSIRVSEALEYGMVGINEGLISTEVAPFGGIKNSGFGREGSKYGIDNFIDIKYLCIGNIN